MTVAIQNPENVYITDTGQALSHITSLSVLTFPKFRNVINITVKVYLNTQTYYHICESSATMSYAGQCLSILWLTV